ncbi:MAG: class 1 fructose-bisphosphatase [Sulfurovum sp.]|nr:class 1 fructose-bisphosphatase [Sulfurovaceae bacterium]
MEDVIDAIKEIAHRIDEAIKMEDLGYSDSENSSGEDQLKLDVQSDMIIEKVFSKIERVKDLVSEEKEGVYHLHDNGKYTICYDPLDGSSLVDVNLSVGSIFGIYEGELIAENMVASIYVIYGPRIEMIVSLRGSKPILHCTRRNHFEEVGEISLVNKGNQNAPGGTQMNWSPTHKEFVTSLFNEGYRLRYSGGMVPDLHQILLKGGGLFSYPATSDKPNGKLRQLFEIIPFALIYEEAGGQAIDENGKRLMELIPSHPHDTSPCFFGSNYEIEAMKKAYGLN